MHWPAVLYLLLSVGEVVEYFWPVTVCVLGMFFALGVARILLGLGMSAVDVASSQRKRDVGESE